MAYDPKDPETIKALKSAVTEAVSTAVEEATEGLDAKNKELLGKLKKAQKGATIDPADHAALQSELDSSEVELAKAKKELKAAMTESEKIKKQYETESQVSRDLLVDTGLSNELLANGIKNPTYLKAAKALLSSQVTLEADGDKRVAKVGDKTLTDHIKEWAGTDEGKAFVDAPGNSGGGANGGVAGNGNAKTMTRTEFGALDPAGQMTFSKEGGIVTVDA
ncbi:hypothetical protein KAR91_26080 [Candidatus Pacearchaeota archaeon]|nr:hypothetical protein [Candidatus Pacearchaeota archaeon]